MKPLNVLFRERMLLSGALPEQADFAVTFYRENLLRQERSGRLDGCEGDSAFLSSLVERCRRMHGFPPGRVAPTRSPAEVPRAAPGATSLPYWCEPSWNVSVADNFCRAMEPDSFGGEPRLLVYARSSEEFRESLDLAEAEDYAALHVGPDGQEMAFLQLCLSRIGAQYGLAVFELRNSQEPAALADQVVRAVAAAVNSVEPRLACLVAESRGLSERARDAVFALWRLRDSGLPWRQAVRQSALKRWVTGSSVKVILQSSLGCPSIVRIGPPFDIGGEDGLEGFVRLASMNTARSAQVFTPPGSTLVQQYMGSGDGHAVLARLRERHVHAPFVQPMGRYAQVLAGFSSIWSPRLNENTALLEMMEIPRVGSFTPAFASGGGTVGFAARTLETHVRVTEAFRSAFAQTVSLNIDAISAAAASEEVLGESAVAPTPQVSTLGVVLEGRGETFAEAQARLASDGLPDDEMDDGTEEEPEPGDHDDGDGEADDDEDDF